MTAEIDFHADLTGGLGRLAADMKALRDGTKRRWGAGDIWRTLQGTTPLSAVGGAFPLPQMMDEGPPTGYAWSVQHISITGLGATTDFVNVYNAGSPAEVQPQNGLHSFAVPIVGMIADWHPGGKGLILMNDENLAFAGTLTGTGAVVRVESIQMSLAALADFLI